MKTLALFDLDNTLLNGDSDHAWGEFLVEQGIVDSDAFKQANDDFYEQYKVGQLDIQAYLEFALTPIANKPMTELKQWHDAFMESKVKPMFQQQAIDCIEKHRALGHELMVITATNRFVTEPIVKALGIELILASEPEIKDGLYTGKPAGTPCYQAGKVTRLNAWLEANQATLAGSYFYSDSHNDLPLLEQVDNPIVVDGDDILLKHAEQQGWPSISFRD